MAERTKTGKAKADAVDAKFAEELKGFNEVYLVVYEDAGYYTTYDIPRGVFTSKEKAIKLADKLNNEYGAARYIVVPYKLNKIKKLK